MTDGLTGDLDGISDFNSHAHVERDAVVVLSIGQIFISTHTLTWSVTLSWVLTYLLPFHFNSHAHVERDEKYFGVNVIATISTHTLTWSVTKTPSDATSGIKFQLTRSRGA